MKSIIRNIKQQFFAMRNGVIADRYRKAGAPYKIIFGLNLPQIADIAAGITPSAPLARWLWNNTSTRESVLIAPMLFPRDEMTPAEAITWIQTASSTEAIDILCHRLLRHLPFATEIATALATAPDDLSRYAAMRLLFNLFPASAAIIAPIARGEARKNNPVTLPLATMIINELEWI